MYGEKVKTSAIKVWKTVNTLITNHKQQPKGKETL